MSTLLTLVAIAILSFWLLGAHNRLVKLRHRHHNHFTPLAAALRQRHAVALTLAESARHLSGSDHDQIEDVLTATREAGSASDGATTRPLRALALQRVAHAEERLGQVLDQLCNTLQDMSYGDAPEPAISELLRQRHALQGQILFAGQVYNDSARLYNDALALFPTTLAARLLRFDPAPTFPQIVVTPALLIAVDPSTGTPSRPGDLI